MIPQYVMPRLPLPQECSIITEDSHKYIEFEELKNFKVTRIAVQVFGNKQNFISDRPYILFTKNNELVTTTCSAIEAALFIPAEDVEKIYREKSALLLEMMTVRVHDLATAYVPFSKFMRNNFGGLTDDGVMALVKWIEGNKDLWTKKCSVEGALFIKKYPPIPFSVVVSRKKNIYLHIKKMLEKGSGKQILTTYEYTNHLRVVRLKPHHKIQTKSTVDLKDVKEHWQNEIRINKILKEAKARGVDMTGIMETIEHVTINKEGVERHLAYQLQCEGDLLNKMADMDEFTRIKHGATVARGLATLHSLNLIHLDLKLENVLLLNGEAKITDFGFAQKIGQQTVLECKGTHGYIAPEFFCDAWFYQFGKITPPIRNNVNFDNWSLGVMLACFLYMYKISVVEPQEMLKVLEFQKQVDVLDKLEEPKKHKTPLGGPLGWVGFTKKTLRLDHVLWGLMRKDPNERWSSAKASQVLQEIISAKDARARIMGCSFAKPQEEEEPAE